MRNVSQGPAQWFIKINPKAPPQTNCYTDTEKHSEGWRENNLPDSKIITHEETQDISHTCEELKGTYSGTTPMQENATASWGFPRERAEFRVQLELGSKCFDSTDILCLPALERFSAQCPVLSLWLPLSSWKNSLIKAQTVAIFPLLKWLKFFLYYVANSTMSLRQVHNTQSFLPPCCLSTSNAY